MVWTEHASHLRGLALALATTLCAADFTGRSAPDHMCVSNPSHAFLFDECAAVLSHVSRSLFPTLVPIRFHVSFLLPLPPSPIFLFYYRLVSRASSRTVSTPRFLSWQSSAF